MISVLIKSAKKFGLKENLVRLWAEKALKKYHLDNCELSLIFIEPKEILNLNKKYRNLNEATSVLTFFQGQAYSPIRRVTPEKFLFGKEGSAEGRFLLLGDIVICPEVAEKKNLTINFLIDHGIRNLLSEIPTAKSLRT
jgi:ssRNA-specific RNase YbeY (16S rRNA maturation enzyme)